MQQRTPILIPLIAMMIVTSLALITATSQNKTLSPFSPQPTTDSLNTLISANEYTIGYAPDINLALTIEGSSKEDNLAYHLIKVTSSTKESLATLSYPRSTTILELSPFEIGFYGDIRPGKIAYREQGPELDPGSITTLLLDNKANLLATIQPPVSNTFTIKSGDTTHTVEYMGVCDGVDKTNIEKTTIVKKVRINGKDFAMPQDSTFSVTCHYDDFVSHNISLPPSNTWEYSIVSDNETGKEHLNITIPSAMTNYRSAPTLQLQLSDKLILSE